MIHVLSNPRKELLLRASSEEEALQKIRETAERYPEESQRYLSDGFRIIDATSVAEAKRKFASVNITDNSGQIRFI